MLPIPNVFGKEIFLVVLDRKGFQSCLAISKFGSAFFQEAARRSRQRMIEQAQVQQGLENMNI